MAKEETKPEQTQAEQTPPPPNEGQKKVLKVVLIVLGVLFALGVLLMVLLAVFGAKIGEEIYESATNSEVERDGDSISFETEDGSLEINSAELPEDFPVAAPLYEPATLLSSSSYSTGDGRIWSVAFTTESSTDEVYEYYQDVFAAEGWETETTVDRGDVKSISASNESERLRVNASIGQDSDDVTEYTLSVTHTEENE